jgi:hypothetical protein
LIQKSAEKKSIKKRFQDALDHLDLIDYINFDELQTSSESIMNIFVAYYANARQELLFKKWGNKGIDLRMVEATLVKLDRFLAQLDGGLLDEKKLQLKNEIQGLLKKSESELANDPQKLMNSLCYGMKTLESFFSKKGITTLSEIMEELDKYNLDIGTDEQAKVMHEMLTELPEKKLAIYKKNIFLLSDQLDAQTRDQKSKDVKVDTPDDRNYYDRLFDQASTLNTFFMTLRSMCFENQESDQKSMNKLSQYALGITERKASANKLHLALNDAIVYLKREESETNIDRIKKPLATLKNFLIKVRDKFFSRPEGTKVDLPDVDEEKINGQIRVGIYTAQSEMGPTKSSDRIFGNLRKIFSFDFLKKKKADVVELPRTKM